MGFEVEGLFAVDLEAVRLEVRHPHEAVLVDADGARAAEHLLRLQVGHGAEADGAEARPHGSDGGLGERRVARELLDVPALGGE